MVVTIYKGYWFTFGAAPEPIGVLSYGPFSPHLSLALSVGDTKRVRASATSVALIRYRYGYIHTEHWSIFLRIFEFASVDKVFYRNMNRLT